MNNNNSQQQQQQNYFNVIQTPTPVTVNVGMNNQNNENASNVSSSNTEVFDAQNNSKNPPTILSITPHISLGENFAQDAQQPQVQQQIQPQQQIQQQIPQQLPPPPVQQEQRDQVQPQVQQSQKSRKQKCPFTPEEDAHLKELVAEKGERAWNVIHTLMPGRSARQCRERWNLYLSPTVNNEPWTPDEVVKLYTLYAAVGPQWTLLSHQFPNRTANNIKNRLKQCLRRAQRMCRIPDKATLDAALNINNNNINSLIKANNNPGGSQRRKNSANRNPKPAAPA